MKILFGMLALTFLFMSCEDDENNNPGEEETQESYFKFDSTKYELSEAILFYHGTDKKSSAYIFILHHMSDGYTIHESDGLIDSVTGTGNSIAFRFQVSDSSNLLKTSYYYNDSTTEANSFRGYAAIDGNTFYETGDLIEIDSGDITVKQNGSPYELDFSGEGYFYYKIPEIHDISAYYNGSVKFYDYSNAYKKSLFKYHD